MSTDAPATEAPAAEAGDTLTGTAAAEGGAARVAIAKAKLNDASEKVKHFLKIAPGASRRFLKIAPQEDETKEGFIPSPFAQWAVVDNKTDYEEVTYENKYTGDQKILMVCTQERYMTMANETKFHTGNHPVEMLVPMMHLEQAGFGIDICTPTGEPVKIEMWAMPEEDEAVKAYYDKKKSDFEKPQSLSDIAASGSNLEKYMGVFIPGGHGACWVFLKIKILPKSLLGPAKTTST